jgi:porin
MRPESVACRAFGARAGCALLALLIGGPAAAEEASGIPEPSIATSLPLNGDPDGFRKRLAGQGITYGINYIGEALGNTSGGQSQGTAYDGRAELVVDADLEKLANWKGGTFHFNVYQIHGVGLTSGQIGNLMAVSNIEAMPTTRLFELWFEQKFSGDKASLRLGQIAADSEFITSTYAGQFINGTFGWPAIAASDLRGGGPAYPLAAPGARLKLDPTADFTLMGAIFSGDPGGPGSEEDPQKRNPYGLNFGFADKPLLMLEAQYRYNQGKSAQGLPGSIKIGGWDHWGDYSDQFTGARLSTNHGVYAVLDQQIYALPKGDGKGIGIFARVAGAPADRNLIEFYVDAGLQFSGFVGSRPDDKFGAAFGYGRISNRAVDADIAAGTLARDYEAVLEVNYTAQIRPGWTLQPEFQYIWHPGGNAVDDGGTKIGDAAVFGLRTVINY